jgi:hypothetical protein
VEGFVKFIGGSQLINELLVSTLARLIGLNVPEPFIVRIDKEDFPRDFVRLGITADFIHTFGTRALPGGSLARRWLLEEPGFLNGLLDGNRQWTRIVAFDTWVGNVDRHLHNLFYDGAKQGTLWMLDHGHCFGGISWSEEDLIGDRNWTNRLLEEFQKLGCLSITRRKAVLDDTHFTQQLSAVVDLDGAIDDSVVRALVPSSTAQKLIDCLYYRSQHLVSLVAYAVGMPTLQLDMQ